MPNLSITDRDGNAKFYAFDATGTSVDPFVSKSPQLLGPLNATPAVTPGDASASLNAILRGLWQAIINLGTPPTMLDHNSMGTATSGVIKASAGNLHMIAATNLNASIRYIQLFNSTTAPAANAVPLKSYPVYPSGGYTPLDTTFFGISAAGKGLFFTNGIAWGMSSTPLVYTATTATETIFEARYV